MKKSFALAALMFALCSTLSCEQQSWEQTKMFNQNRHAEGHGEGHGAHGEKAGGAHALPAAGHQATPAVAH